jgi:ABC-2 type transport system permease protein
MTSSGYFRIVRVASVARETDRVLDTGAAAAAVVVPYDFSDRLRAGEPTEVQVLIDGSDSNTATIAQGYAIAMIQRFEASWRSAAPARAPISRSRRGAVEVATRVWYNPELKSVNFIVPGIIAVIMMIVGAVLTALSIAKEKERGSIEQILVSPIRPLEMMIGKIVPYTVIALIDLFIVIAAGVLLFQVPIKGSFFQLALFSILYLVCSLGIGVFVSTIADSMQSAMIAAIFLSLMPSVLLSGFVFPIEHMPIAIRALTYFFPGRYFVTAIRGIYLKGVGIGVLWPEAVLLTIFAVAIVGLSASRFGERLE